MNVLFLLFDSLNREYLSCYGNDWVKTPNIQRLADCGVVFDNHYMGSAPCMPARRELFSGKIEFLWRGWGNAEPFDENLARIVRESGAYTAVSTDHAHFWDRSHGYGYIEQFEDREMVRGQEGDRPIAPWISAGDLPEWARSMAEYWPEDLCVRYYRNVMSYKGEDDFHVARVMTGAAAALSNIDRDSRSFIYVDSFDPHEPWLTPEPYRSMYGEYRPDITCWPPYPWTGTAERFFNDTSAEDRVYIKRQYAGNVSMVDAHLKQLFDVLDERDLWQSTAVILTTDHGHDLGDRGSYGKNYPHYNSHAHLPLIIWHPDFPGHRRTDTFSTMVDLHATVRDIAGAGSSPAIHGRSLIPVLAGDTDAVRDGVLFGTFGVGACWADASHTFFSGYDNEASEPMWYSTMPARDGHLPRAESGMFMPGVDVPVWRFPRRPRWRQPVSAKPLVYDKADELQQTDLSGDPRVLATSRLRLRRALEELHCPAEQFTRLLLSDEAG